MSEHLENCEGKVQRDMKNGKWGMSPMLKCEAWYLSYTHPPKKVSISWENKIAGL